MYIHVSYYACSTLCDTGWVLYKFPLLLYKYIIHVRFVSPFVAGTYRQEAFIKPDIYIDSCLCLCQQFACHSFLAHGGFSVTAGNLSFLLCINQHKDSNVVQLHPLLLPLVCLPPVLPRHSVKIHKLLSTSFITTQYNFIECARYCTHHAFTPIIKHH